MNENEPQIEVEEYNLEDLLVLGEDKKIPILIEYPTSEGTDVKAKALVKQLTLKEINDLQVTTNDFASANSEILKRALFKSNGSNFTIEEIEALPIGVVNAIGEKIIELSGVRENTQKKLKDF